MDRLVAAARRPRAAEPHTPPIVGMRRATSRLQAMADASHAVRDLAALQARAARSHALDAEWSPGTLPRSPAGLADRVPRRGETPIQRQTIGETMFEYLQDNLAILAPLRSALRRQLATLKQQGILAPAESITREKLANALLDPSLDLTALQSPDMLPLLIDYLAQPLEANYSACYNTAASLFGLLGANEQVGPGSNDSFTSVRAFSVPVNNLRAALRDAVQQRQERIFRVSYAGHGFVLATRPDAGNTMVVEHLESLAHTASLISSLGYDAYRVGAVRDALGQMSSRFEFRRRKGAGFFGWNHAAIHLGTRADNGGHPFYEFGMKWWVADLLPNWAAQWQQEIRNRYNQLAGLFGVAAW